jgi:hypothetical protein
VGYLILLVTIDSNFLKFQNQRTSCFKKFELFKNHQGCNSSFFLKFKIRRTFGYRFFNILNFRTLVVFIKD